MQKFAFSPYLKQHESGMPTKDVIRQAGITEQTSYRCKNNFGGMELTSGFVATVVPSGEHDQVVFFDHE